MVLHAFFWRVSARAVTSAALEETHGPEAQAALKASRGPETVLAGLAAVQPLIFLRLFTRGRKVSVLPLVEPHRLCTAVNTSRRMCGPAGSWRR
jgi:hypothetical protein